MVAFERTLVCGCALGDVYRMGRRRHQRQRGSLGYHLYYWCALCILFFCLATWRLHALKNRFFDLQLEEMLPDEHPKKRKVLICFLSEAQGNRKATLDENGALVFDGRTIPLDTNRFTVFEDSQGEPRPLLAMGSALSHDPTSPGSARESGLGLQPGDHSPGRTFWQDL